MKFTLSHASRAKPAHAVRPAGARWRWPAIGRTIQRAVVSLFTHVFALLAAGITGVIMAIVALYVAGLLLGLAAELLGASIGEATEVVGAISVITFSLLAGLTLGTEVYAGVVQTGDQCAGPMPGWLRSLWAAAAGALVGALPCAATVDWLLLGPAQALHPHGIDSAVTFGTATHLVSLGALTGAVTGIVMERFRIWRRPTRGRSALPSQIAGPVSRGTDAALIPADSEPVLPRQPQERVAQRR